MSTLVDKDYLQLPQDVLWNLTRLSRFALHSVNINENEDKATMSLTFDKTVLGENYTKTLNGKYKQASPALDSNLQRRKSLLSFDPNSPLRPPIKNINANENVNNSNNSYPMKKAESIPAGALSLNQSDPTEKVKIKSEPISPKSIKSEYTESTESQTTCVKMENAASPEARKETPEHQRAKISFPLPSLKTMSSNVLLMQQPGKKGSSTKSRENRSRGALTRQCAIDQETEILSSKLSKLSVKEKLGSKDAKNKDEKSFEKTSNDSKKVNEKVKKLSPPKSYSDKENSTPYYDTVKYYLDKAHRHIDSSPKMVSKYDYTYSINDGKEFGQFAIEWTDDLKKHPKVVKNDRVTLAWLKSNIKHLPSYIRRQATYRVIEKELDYYSDSDVVPRDKRKLIAELLDH